MGDYEFHLREEWKECVQQVKDILRFDPDVSITDLHKLTGINYEHLPAMRSEAEKTL